MIETVGDHAEGQSFRLRYGLLAGLPVDHDAWQVWHFGNPASVLFSIDFDLHPVDLHNVMYRNRSSMGKGLSPFSSILGSQTLLAPNAQVDSGVEQIGDQVGEDDAEDHDDGDRFIQRES